MARRELTAPDRRGPDEPAIRRLSAYDEHCLRVETTARPIQVGILSILDGRSLFDAGRRLRLTQIRGEIERRLGGLPELRRVVFRPGPLAGRPLWIDDPSFRIEHHVDVVEVRPPGDDVALLATVEGLLASPLDRSRPLWRLWFVTGLPAGRVGLLVILHHALADGLSAMRMVRSLLEPPMPATGDPPAGPATAPVPVAASPRNVLVRDHLRSTIASALRLIRPSTLRLVASAAPVILRAYVYTDAELGPRTSLNAPVGPHRRLTVVRLDLATARRVARRHGCGVQDVVLGVVAGGVRALLDARGEPIERVRPRVGIAVARFSRADGGRVGNDIGSIVVPLSIDTPDLDTRLRVIASARERAAASPMVAAEPTIRAWLGRIPLVRRSIEHQRIINVTETYLPGPPVPIEVLGAPVLDLLPIAPIAGNLGLSFVALSYAGQLSIAVRADADQFPDLDELTTAMGQDWDALARAVEPDPGDGTPSVGDEVGSAA